MAVRQKTAPSSTELRRLVDEEILAPLAEKFDRAEPRQAAIPEIVFENRRKRARQRISDALVSRGSRRFPNNLRRDVRELFRQWAVHDFDDGFAPALEFEIQAARERDLAIALESGDSSQILQAHERAYRARVIERYGRIELRGVQTSHRVLLDLDQVYVPLHLEEAFRAGNLEPASGVAQSMGAFGLLRTSVEEALRTKERILVVGGPGSGKSTIVGYLAARLAAAKTPNDPEADTGLLPLVLIAREMREANLSIDAIAELLECDPTVVEASLKHKRALLVLDGLDEAKLELQEGLASQLEKLADRHPGIRVLVTSRPSRAFGEIEQSLPFLHPYRIADFSRQDVEDFVDRWCLAAETSVRTDRAAAEKEAKKAATDLKQRIESNRSVQRIAANPLLATILCIVHRFLGHKIPERRATLYEKCTDALLYEWDQAKFPEGAAMGQLDAPAKRRLLMGVARKLHENHLAEVPRSEVESIFAQTLPELGRGSQEASVLTTDIRDRSGLLVERRPGWFAFSHLSFQEYLTALDFVRTKEVKKLVDRYQEPWWQEVILLSAGLPGASPGEVVEALLGKKGRLPIIMAARCLETAVELPLRLRKRVEKSLGDIVPPRKYEQVRELVSLGPVLAPVLAQTLPSSLSKGTWDPDWSLTIYALAKIDYEPSIPTLLQAIHRKEPFPFVIEFEWENSSIGFSPQFNIGQMVTLGLLVRAAASDSERAAQAFRKALEMNRTKAFDRTLSHLAKFAKRGSRLTGLIEAAFKEAPREKPPAKPAPNTA